jgi:hypothetical protein
MAVIYTTPLDLDLPSGQAMLIYMSIYVVLFVVQQSVVITVALVVHSNSLSVQVRRIAVSPPPAGHPTLFIFHINGSIMTRSATSLLLLLAAALPSEAWRPAQRRAMSDNCPSPEATVTETATVTLAPGVSTVTQTITASLYPQGPEGPQPPAATVTETTTLTLAPSVTTVKVTETVYPTDTNAPAPITVTVTESQTQSPSSQVLPTHVTVTETQTQYPSGNAPVYVTVTETQTQYPSSQVLPTFVGTGEASSTITATSTFTPYNPHRPGGVRTVTSTFTTTDGQGSTVTQTITQTLRPYYPWWPTNSTMPTGTGGSGTGSAPLPTGTGGGSSSVLPTITGGGSGPWTNSSASCTSTALCTSTSTALVTATNMVTVTAAPSSSSNTTSSAVPSLTPTLSLNSTVTLTTGSSTSGTEAVEKRGFWPRQAVAQKDARGLRRAVVRHQ